MTKQNFQRPFKEPTNYQRVLDEFKKQPNKWFTFEDVNTFSLISGMKSSTKSRALFVLVEKGFLERREIANHHYEYRFPTKPLPKDPVHFESKTTYECSHCHIVSKSAFHESHSPCQAKMLERGAGWYFWDETWAYRYGPYPTREEAKEACASYAKSLE